MKKIMNTMQKSRAKGGVTEMKKILTLVVLLAMVALPTGAFAQVSLYFDLGSVDTDLFDRMDIATIDATSNYAAGIFPGATFVDTGDFQVGALTLGGAAVDDKGLNAPAGWELTGRWTNLSGTLDTIGQVGPTTTFTFTYESGAAELYMAQGADQDITPGSFGGVGSDDDDVGDFTNGLKIADISLVTGNGILGITPGFAPIGATQTTWSFVDVAPGVWFAADGTDLETLLESAGYLNITTTVQEVQLVDTDGDQVPDKILSRNTGDATIPVPEPTTILLFGSGLLGLAGLRKRKSA